jgi:hypothetical protein
VCAAGTWRVQKEGAQKKFSLVLASFQCAELGLRCSKIVDDWGSNRDTTGGAHYAFQTPWSICGHRAPSGYDEGKGSEGKGNGIEEGR